MKILIVGINAKYIHTNLAIRYLYHALPKTDCHTEMKEFTINQHEEEILQDIYLEQPDIIAFSCYIWNIQVIHRLGNRLKKVLPETTLILGGPEISFDTEETMKEHDYIDLVVRGEGEETFTQLISAFQNEEDYSECLGISFRAKGKVYSNPEAVHPLTMKDLPFPYQGEVLDRNKIYYYESTRGCPYQCSYCLSSTVKGVRYAELEDVKKELNVFLDQKMKMVKFVDRTFNCNKRHAMEIMSYLIENHNGVTIFHFEITAELLDEEMLAFLKTVPKGVFQFEAGVQSTNPETLEAIQRNIPFHHLQEPLKQVMEMENIHLHLDLIAGLPFEDYYTFRHSFNQVYSLGGDQLQLGFLKLLKGSALRERQEEFGYVFDHEAPYEVLENRWLNYGDLLRLKDIEKLLEKYTNEHRFRRSLPYLIEEHYHDNPFRFYEALSLFWRKRGYFKMSQSLERFYSILLEFFEENEFMHREYFMNRLQLDYLVENQMRKIPGELQVFNENEKLKLFPREKAHQFLQDDRFREIHLSHYKGEPAKKVMKKIEFILLGYSLQDLDNSTSPFVRVPRKTVVMIDLSEKTAHEVNQLEEAE